jgi:hypothetical protein
MPKPLAEHPQIEAAFGEGLGILLYENCHIFTLDEFLSKFS